MRGTGWLWVTVVLAFFAACSSATENNSNTAAGGSGAAAGDASVGGSAGVAGSSGAAGAAGQPVNPATTVTVIGPGAPQDAPSKFGGPEDPSQHIDLVYPFDGTVTPPNLNSLEFHFTPSAGEDLFEIRFVSAAIEYIVYVGCTPVGNGCAYDTDPQFWSQLVGANRGTPPVHYRVRGVNQTSAGKIGLSDTHTIAFSKEDIVGGLYYWNAGGGAIERYDFGLPLQAPEVYLTPQLAGLTFCVGCHALSRDGKRMAVGSFIPAPAPYKVFDVATRTALPAGDAGTVGGAANFFSFDPPGKKLLFSNGSDTGIQDLATGTIENTKLIAGGTMPDWSPDGSLIVYAASASPPPVANPGVTSAGINIVQYDNGSVGPPSPLVPFKGQNNYYPAFNPTQTWVAFNRSPSNMDSYSAGPPTGDGELWAARVQDGLTVRLDAANGNGHCSWPKWVPDVGSYYGGTIMYLTVSSARAYGLRKAAGGTVQLWMAAFDPKKGDSGDPSFPAFWFPYQDLASGNHIAQWVTSIERQPCLKDTDCQGNEKCVQGKCVPIIK